MMRWALGLIVLLVSAFPAGAGNWWPHFSDPYGLWHPILPACGDTRVLSYISTEAAWAEHHTWHRGWVIHSISRIGETALDPGPSKVHRRYCYGTAYLSDGRTTSVVYVIEAGQGFSSMGFNAEYCMPAYDPWRIADSWCRAIRP